MNKQVSFEFGHGSMILDKVIPLERWKKNQQFSHCFVEMYVLG
jgi:hypothetical protein